MVVRRLCALVIALLVVPGLAWGAPQGKVVIAQGVDPTTLDTQNQQEIGRASCRERVLYRV